ncbi:hypothetical protein BD408DRAFT_437590 [Parasitella parasitica]|nr:hypothetical protein BD408DRAFT_437590 [Parasitella parasitica]
MEDIIEIDDDVDMYDMPPLLTNQYRSRKIVFCIDISDEMNTTLRATGNCGIKDPNLYNSSRLETIQRFLKRYVAMNKLIGNEADEYAMILLTDIAIWCADFTSNMSIFHNYIDNISIAPLNHYYDFDAQSLADTLNDNLNVQNTDFYYHTIVIYSRPTVVPTNMTNNIFQDMRKRRNFMLDVLFLHDVSAESEVIQVCKGTFVLNPR